MVWAHNCISEHPIGGARVINAASVPKRSDGAIGAVERVLKPVPDLEVKTIASPCCGIAGPLGSQAETYDVSMAMGALSLLPAIH